MTTIDLRGQWQVRHDPLSQGVADRWWQRPPHDGWREIVVPAAWQIALGIEARGLAWYRRSVPPEAIAWARDGARARLRFESVATECRVWISDAQRGYFCGGHEGDYIPFEIDVTDALKSGSGETWLYVRVDQQHAPRPAKGVVVEHGHIGKGFHDVLSAQHAGIWGGVSLRRTGPASLRPNGVSARCGPADRCIEVEAELSADHALPARYELRDPDGAMAAQGPLLGRGTLCAAATLGGALALWSPASPALYTLDVWIGDGDQGDRQTQRVGFRRVTTGGPGNSQILLNGQPLQIRGLLDWGHEPRHTAPAATQAEVRENFTEMRARGFNCIALCMFYPPEHFFDIADELGMLVWQVQPVWKSRMSAALMPEYRRLYEAYLRRDRRHASVVIVSGACEHEVYDEELGRWWWEASGRLLPQTLRQLQTGFLEQVPPDLTHLYDDHVYDNCGRWVCFHNDMQQRIAELPPRPFIMGETIISNAWPDVAALRAAAGDPQPWWLTRGLDECAAFERDLERRGGAAGLARFKSQGERFAKEFRKFQAEILRMHPRNAGFVTNSIRDVPICRLGFKDDLDRWRFAPEDTRPWLGDEVLLLETPEHLRGFTEGFTVNCRLGISNFGPHLFVTRPTVMRDEAPVAELALSAKRGAVGWTSIEIAVPACEDGAARVFDVSASAAQVGNRWRLVALPQSGQPADIARLDGLPFTEKEREPEFEERAYSSGWCLPCRSWSPRLPDTAALLPAARTIAADAVIPRDVRCLITHRLTRRVAAYLQEGGRVVLLAHRHAGGMGSKWINLWGQLPLIVESGRPHAVIRHAEGDAVLALLHYDLTRWTTRAIPVDDLGDMTDHVEPIIRYVWTHDAGVPKRFDAAFRARFEKGLLLVSCLDHSGPAGAWLLNRMLEFARAAELGPAGRELEIERFLYENATPS